MVHVRTYMWLNAVNCIPLTPVLYIRVTRPSRIFAEGWWARLSSSQVNHTTLRESIDVNGWFCCLKGVGLYSVSTSPVHQSSPVIVDGPTNLQSTVQVEKSEVFLSKLSIHTV